MSSTTRRQQRADGQHHHDHADQRDRRGDQLRQALLQRGADVIHVVDGAAQDLAMGARVKELQRQRDSFSSTSLRSR